MKRNKLLIIYFTIMLFFNTNIVKAAETLDDLSPCENPGFLRIIYFIKILINILQIIVPIGLIVIGSIDFSKSVSSSDEDIQKKSAKLFGKRLIFAFIFFSVPWIIQTLMVYFGNLSNGVNFTDCLENANLDDISELQVRYDEIIENNKSKNTPNNSSGSNDSGNNDIDTSGISPAVIENLASFSGSEVGYYKDDFWGGLLVEAAVFINNYDYQKSYSGVDINTPVTTESMCKVFSVYYGKYYLYTPLYCNYTFDKLADNRGGVTEHQKELMTKAAELVLSKEFTIPKNVIYAMGIDNNQNLTGVLYTSTSNQKFGTGGQAFATTDVYGNTVSTDPSWYSKRIDELYKKYFG